MSIKVSQKIEVKIEMVLNESEASDLLFFLRTGVTPVRAPSLHLPIGIVRNFADALLEKGVK